MESKCRQAYRDVAGIVLKKYTYNPHRLGQYISFSVLTACDALGIKSFTMNDGSTTIPKGSHLINKNPTGSSVGFLNEQLIKPKI